MNPALRDCIGKLETGGFPPYVMAVLEKVVNLLTVKGVKIGGRYRHFKGLDYIVLDVVRDADDWESWKVVYYEAGNATHRAERKLESFLGDVVDNPKYKGPRFKLVE